MQKFSCLREVFFRLLDCIAHSLFSGLSHRNIFFKELFCDGF